MIEGFFCCAFLYALSFLFGVIYAYLQPYCHYCLYKSKNKIEWKCEETENNYDQRIKTYSKQRIEFEICYRIKPSEVNWLVRIFGDNDWNYPFSQTFWFYEDDAEKEFKGIIKGYETLDDVRKLERKEGRIKLYK